MAPGNKIGTSSPVRATAFNIVFYLNMLAFILAAMPLLIFPRQYLKAFLHLWCRTSLWWLKALIGTNCEIKGQQNIPEGALLVAAKHQSFWETFALLPLFTDPVIVLKRELTWIPLLGWILRKYGCISVDRAGASKALRAMLEQARQAAQENRQIIIFPEGTRKDPDAAPDYKPGVGLLYVDLKIPCLPIALNSGLYWPRRRPERHPGTLLVDILPPIPPGLTRKQFLPRIEAEIETATAKLVAEARDQ
jgi:1-acyl-sn-glycerol-3-phosphate acyltransferase